MPYSLSEEQIDFILADIKQRGIEIEKLQINLLDHICCLLEEKMKEGDDFENTYKTIIEDFHENGMKGLEREAKGLIQSKFYYKYKVTLYILFIGSISYNIFESLRYTANYFRTKQEREEVWTIEGLSLETGYKDLLQKLKSTYPKNKTKDYILVDYEFHEELDPFPAPWDTSITKMWEAHKKYSYRALDTLAQRYPNVTFVIAYQRSNEVADRIINKYKSETQHLLYLKDMNKLLSGFYNNKNFKGWNFPTLFILDKKGKIIYELESGVERIFYINRFLKTLPK